MAKARKINILWIGQASGQVRDNTIYLYAGDLHMRCGNEIHLVRHAGTKEGGLRFSRNGSLYPGDLSLTVSGGILLPVLTLSVEEYLRGVLPYEDRKSVV